MLFSWVRKGMFRDAVDPALVDPGDPSWAWWVYEEAPVDDWTGWHSLQAIEEDQARESRMAGLPPAYWFKATIPQLAAVFRQMGWEGDGNWFLSAVPDPMMGGISPLLVAVKQSNNGTTYVACERELPWLEGAFDGSTGQVFLAHVRHPSTE